MRKEKQRVYIKGRGFAEVAKRVLNQILGNEATKTFALAALKKGAEIGGDKMGEVVAKKLTEKLLPQREKEELKTVLEELQQKVKKDITSYNQLGAGYKIIR